jgi:hypothetical protein
MVAGDQPQGLPTGSKNQHQRRLSKTPHQGDWRPIRDRNTRRKSGKKLQAIICILLVELCERFSFFGIVCNMMIFCTVKLGYGNYLAATVNLCFVGVSTLTPVLVGWFAETYLGRTKVLYFCAFLHFFGQWSYFKLSNTVYFFNWHCIIGKCLICFLIVRIYPINQPGFSDFLSRISHMN